ncbi:MAG: Vgb family protein [Planctomycetota bacterium]
MLSILRLGAAALLTSTTIAAQFTGSDYYVSSPGGGGIYKGDFVTGQSSVVGLGLLVPHYGWFGNDGNFYVPDRGWPALMKLTPAGEVSFFSVGGNWIKPVTIIPSLDDRAFVVSDMGASKILRVEYDGSQTVMHDQASTNGLLNWPDGMAFDDAGNLYVANLGDNKLIKIDPQGQASVFSDSPLLSEPGGITIDGAGNLFAANYATHSITRFRLDTGEAEFFSGNDQASMAAPNDLKLSRKGGMLVAGRNGRVSRIDALGNITVVYHDPTLGEFDGVAVPEDATLCTGRYTTYGEGLEGTGGITPKLQAIYSPCAGQTVGIEFRDFVGGATAVLFVGTQALPVGAMTLKGAPLLVDPAGTLFWPIPLGLPGAGQGAGAGDLTLQFTVPENPGLAGLELYHQVFAADPAALNGVSASNGLKEVFGL